MASTPTPAVRKAIQDAEHWGDFTEQDGRIYRPGSDKPVCSKQTVLALVECGWLKPWRSRYQITREGERAALEFGGRRPS
jgi:hypothetical protein